MLSAKKIVVATGYYDVPNLLECARRGSAEGYSLLQGSRIRYYDHDVAVIGAKNSAAIAALELWWTGARVTLIHRGPGIHNNVKYWIKPNIENRIKNGEIPGYFHSEVMEIRPDSITVRTPEGDYRSEE